MAETPPTSPAHLSPQKNDQGDEDLFLDDTWAYYFHDPYKNDWRYMSYIKIATFSSANEFWGIDSALQDNVAKGMFFIMREHVFPIWDDRHNINGGCLSLKVPKEDVLKAWRNLCTLVLSEEIKTKHHISDEVNGLSISPKFNFCIIKLWMDGVEMADPEKRPDFLRNVTIFKSNRDSIHQETR